MKNRHCRRAANVKCFAAAMSEFKYACPVCGQHIKCDSSQAGSVMECPTCFQKITVPQAPATDDQKFIITGTKVGERPVPTIPEYRAVEPEKNFPTALVVTLPCPGLHCRRGCFFVSRKNFQIHRTACADQPDRIRFGTNSARPAPIKLSPAQLAPRHGAIGLGSWNTEVEYSNVVVTKGTNILYRSDFQPGAHGWRTSNGRWIANNNVFIQSAQVMDARAVTGDTAWSDYTVSVKARKLGGREGFRVMFNVQDDRNWTCGISAAGTTPPMPLKPVPMASKPPSFITNQPRILTGSWYDIRIEIQGTNLRCYLNDQLIHDATYPSPEPR